MRHIVYVGLSITYDDTETTEDAVVDAVINCCDNALGTPGVLDAVGDPAVGNWHVQDTRELPEVAVES